MRTLSVWLFVVFVLSVYPFKGESQIPHADKALHFMLYAITCALFVVVFRKPLRTKKTSLYGVLLISIAASAGYGLLMEAVQSFIPGRSFSLWDEAANVLGAVAGAAYIRMKGPRL